MIEEIFWNEITGLYKLHITDEDGNTTIAEIALTVPEIIQQYEVDNGTE